MRKPVVIRVEGLHAVPVFERIGAAIARLARSLGIALITSARAPSGPEGWRSPQYDGVITVGAELADGGSIRVNKPVILVSSRHAVPPLPRVISDDAAIGAAAARHLLACGARQLLGLDWVDLGYVRRRLEGFATAARAAGMPCRILDWSRAMNHHAPAGPLGFARAFHRKVLRLFRRLPKLTGIFVTNDDRAASLLNEAEAAGWRAPDHFLIIGVDNVEQWGLAPVSGLSSVIPDCDRIAEVALHRILGALQTHRLPEGDVLIPPLGVAARRSTDRAASVTDPLVAAAVRRVRSGEYLDEQASTLARHLGVSRATLYRRFQAALGQRPGELIEQARLDAARRLLLETPLPVEQIAYQCGYRDASAFGRAFRRAEGCSPGEWRKTRRPTR